MENQLRALLPGINIRFDRKCNERKQSHIDIQTYIRTIEGVLVSNVKGCDINIIVFAIVGLIYHIRCTSRNCTFISLQDDTLFCKLVSYHIVGLEAVYFLLHLHMIEWCE